MAKITIKKLTSAAKKGESASGDSGCKTKKGGKDRTKGEGKGKWHGSINGGDDLGAELAALGLRIKDITGDGNCFFRALGDQLQGDEGLHGQLRQQVVSYMADRGDEFSPFVEDDERLEAYLTRMKKDGVWAGYMEVVAASRCLGANLTIYQAGQPRWRVVHHPEDSCPMLHLSYHDGQHYNSVRCADDFGGGPPAPVVIRGNGTIALRPERGKQGGGGSWDERDERHVATSTACTDKELVRRALEEAGGDVDLAIERVIEALAAAETPETEDAAAAAGAAAAAAAAPEGMVSEVGAAGAAEAAPGDGLGSGRSDLHQVDSSVAAVAGSVSPASTGIARRDSDGGAIRAGERENADGSQVGTAGSVAADPTGGSAAESPAGAIAVASEAAATAVAAPAAAGGAGGGGKSAPAMRKMERRKGAAAGGAAVGGASNNKRCPCGSSKKFKACCGPAVAAAERRRAAAGGSEAAGASSDAQPGAMAVVAQVAALVL